MRANEGPDKLSYEYTLGYILPGKIEIFLTH